MTSVLSVSHQAGFLSGEGGLTLASDVMPNHSYPANIAQSCSTGLDFCVTMKALNESDRPQ